MFSIGACVLFLFACAAQQAVDQKIQPAAGELVWRAEIDLPPGNHRLVLLRDRPVRLVEAFDIDTRETVHDPRLVTVTPTVVEGGLLLGEDCPQVIRLDELLVSGLIRSEDDRRLRVTLEDGKSILVLRGEKIFVGPHTFKQVLVDRSAVAMMTLGQWECRCECEIDGLNSVPVSGSCGNCWLPGDQCEGGDGSACEVTLPEHGVRRGTLVGCHEIFVYDVGGPQ